MDEISTRLDRLLYETEIYESRQQVEAAVRLVDTMSSYMEELGAPSYRHSVMYSNEQILREIRSVSDLLHTVLQEYIFIEIGVISDINGQLRSCSIAITFLAALLLLVIIMAAVDSCRSVQRDRQAGGHVGPARGGQSGGARRAALRIRAGHPDPQPQHHGRPA